MPRQRALAAAGLHLHQRFSFHCVAISLDLALLCDPTRSSLLAPRSAFLAARQALLRLMAKKRGTNEDDLLNAALEAELLQVTEKKKKKQAVRS